MKVLHTIGSLRSDHGGPSRSVASLSEALAKDGVDTHLVTASPQNPSPEQRPVLPDGEVHLHVIKERSWLQRTLRSPLGFFRRLWSVAEEIRPDIIHDHGAWLPSNAVAAWVAKRTEVPLVVSPRGMAAGWTLSYRALKKHVAWHAYQKHVFRWTTLFHATAPDEADDLRSVGMDAPVAVIPNGVEVPTTLSTKATTENRRALFLSRLHPVKGLPMLLEAWANVRPEGWVLEVVGPSEDGHRRELERQTTGLGLAGKVVFSGPIDDAAKWDKYAAADLFALPSHSENFGTVVAEALAAGVPVLTTTGAPWRDLEEHDCGWWVDPKPEAIAGALSTATSQNEESLRAMGERGRKLVEEKYTWQGVGRKMKKAYEWVLGGSASRPSYIRPSSS